jgi:hypothetical protein
MAPPHAGARLGRLTPRGRPRTPAKGSTVLGVGALLHGRGYQFLRDIGVPLRRRYELECDVVYIDGQFVSPNPEKPGKTSLDRQLSREVGHATHVLEHIFQRREGEAPFMPLQQAPQRILDFDRISFATFLDGLGPLTRRLFKKNIASDAANALNACLVSPGCGTRRWKNQGRMKGK